jgi:hypothetical protein
MPRHVVAAPIAHAYRVPVAGPGTFDEGATLPPTHHQHDPWRVELHWRVIDGRPECVGLAVSVDPERPDLHVTGSTLRALAIPVVIAAHRAEMMAGPVEPAPAGMRRSTAERFRRIADVYRQALTEGRKPVQAVAEAFDVTPASASTLVARTRAAGFLPPASPGVATG